MSKLPERCARRGLGWLLGLAVGIGCCATAPAQSPAWWTNRGVLVTNLAPSDYALANQGQVKWLATNAYNEFQLMLPGDNSGLHDAVSGFTQTGNYLPVNLGQLKALAKPFYDRITAVAAGEPYLTNARPTGVTTNYPWTYTITDDADYAPANLGQVKYVWSIDFDRDADGLPDWWEMRVFGNLSQSATDDPDGDGCDNLCEYQQGSDPGDYFNNVLPYLEIVSKNRHCTVSNSLALPLVIRATDSNDTALVNAPLMFAVTNGTAQFASCTNGPMSTNLHLRTDYEGLAETWLFLPTNAVVTNHITVTAISGTNQVQMQLLVWLEDPAGRFYMSQMDINGPGIGLDSAGTILWKNPPPPPAVTNSLTCTNCGGGTPVYPPSNTNLWLEITDITTNREVLLTLHNTTSNLYYQLLFKRDMGEPEWRLGEIVQDTWGTNALEFAPVSATGHRFFRAQGADTKISARTYSSFISSVGAEPCPSDSGSALIATLGINREGSTASNLTVYYSMNGSAINGVDYTNELGANLPGFVTFSAGEAEKQIQIIAKPDNLVEFTEMATLTLLRRSNYVIVPAAAAATATIADCLTNDLFTVVAGGLGIGIEPNPAGLDYHEPSRSLLVSVGDWQGTNFSFIQIKTNGITNWTTLQNLSSDHNSGDEIKLATVKVTTNGFTQGEMYFGWGTNYPGRIGRVSADGQTVTTNWVQLPTTNTFRGGFYVDQTGVFSNDLIAVTGNAEPGTNHSIWRISAGGNSNLITTLSTRHLEGVVTLPNDTNKWGPWAGKIITGDKYFQEDGESKPLIYAIAPNGTVTSHALGVFPEDFDIIPNDVTNQNLYCTDPEFGDHVLKFPGYLLTNYIGDLVITDEGVNPAGAHAAGLLIVHWDGTNFVSRRISYPGNSHFEHSTFAPKNIIP